MKRMWRVLMGCAFSISPPRDISIMALICDIMSVGLKRLTSVSSMSLRRLICTPRPETSLPVALALGRDFVDLVDVDDAKLGRLGVVPGDAVEVAHEVFHVRADVARLGEFGRVGLGEGHPDEFGDVAHEVGLAHARGAEEGGCFACGNRARRAWGSPGNGARGG